MIDRFEGIQELRITKHETPKIVGDHTRFDPSKFDRVKLEELKERYELESVICCGKNDWEMILLLRDWISKRWKYGFSNMPEPSSSNAVDIVKAVM